MAFGCVLLRSLGWLQLVEVVVREAEVVVREVQQQAVYSQKKVVYRWVKKLETMWQAKQGRMMRLLWTRLRILELLRQLTLALIEKEMKWILVM